MSKMDIKLKKVITPEFRASFPSVDSPQSFKNQEAKYKVTMLFDKKTTKMDDIKRALHNAALEKYGSDIKTWPKLRGAIRDGDKKVGVEGYAGHWYVTATSKSKPGLVDYPNRNDILEKGAFYAGCYGRAELIAFHYDFEGNKGVSFSLQNLQKIRDGKPFSGKKSATEAFADDAKFDTGGSADDPMSYQGDEGGDAEAPNMGFDV
jgi:hypothetical protein